jgi:outer membrane protein OmpA-like peptidoglycan-associated protein
MRHFIATSCVLSLTLIAGGCATKKYVRNTTAPVQAKVDQVGEQTQKQGQEIQENKNQIKTVDDNAQSGISAAKERAMTADNHAGEAMNRANQVGTELTQVNQQVNQRVDQTNANLDTLRSTVANLDDYKMAGEASIPFRFNKYSLDNQSKEDLDKLVADAGKYKRFFISVEGFTDTTGTVAYNEELSRKRADAVVQYLVTKHDIPIYRIHMIGLGKEKPVDMGKNRAARAKNRRVEVRIYSADQGAAVSQVTQPAK